VDERSVQAWYWLSRVVESVEERQICLENVLALDPGHTAVQADLAELRRRMAESEQRRPFFVEGDTAPFPQVAEQTLIASPSVKTLPCPYCGAQGDAADRRCPTCDRDLYTREPKSRGHSIYSLGLVIAWFGLANCTWLGLFVYYVVAGVSTSLATSPGLSRTLETVRSLLGLGASGLPSTGLLQWPVLVVGGFVFVCSLVIAWGLYQRLCFFYWLTVALMLVFLLAGVYVAAQAERVPWVAMAMGGVLGLFTLSFAFMAYDEYTWVERRFDASIDSDVDSASALYGRGQAYAGQGMWAKAATHWAKAVALNPGNPDYRTALAVAYINLDQPEQAREHLEAARQIGPNNGPEGRQIEALLESVAQMEHRVRGKRM